MDAAGFALVVASGSAAGAAALVFGARRVRRIHVGVVEGHLSRMWENISSLEVIRRAQKADELARRRAACLSDLAVLLDVVTLGLSAGLSFDSSLELYCDRYDTELAQAFSQAMLSWRIGAESRDAALARLGDELEVSALSSFASVVSESLAFGTPLASSLERQAQVLRDEQRSQVEEAIERVPVKMLVPLGTLIVPAMFLAILGPLLGSALVIG